MNLKEIVEQLEKCKFTDEIGHPLENNVAFVELKKMAETASTLERQIYKSQGVGSEKLFDVKKILEDIEKWCKSDCSTHPDCAEDECILFRIRGIIQG